MLDQIAEIAGSEWFMTLMVLAFMWKMMDNMLYGRK